MIASVILCHYHLDLFRSSGTVLISRRWEISICTMCVRACVCHAVFSKTITVRHLSQRTVLMNFHALKYFFWFYWFCPPLILGFDTHQVYGIIMCNFKDFVSFVVIMYSKICNDFACMLKNLYLFFGHRFGYKNHKNSRHSVKWESFNIVAWQVTAISPCSGERVQSDESSQHSGCTCTQNDGALWGEQVSIFTI